jgi:hypothetical protein
MGHRRQGPRRRGNPDSRAYAEVEKTLLTPRETARRQALFDRIRRGDPEAADELWRCYRCRLLLPSLIKFRWGLSGTEAERLAAGEMLRTCADQPAPALLDRPPSEAGQ